MAQHQIKHGDYRDRLPPAPNFPWPEVFAEPTQAECEREERAAKRRVTAFKRKGWLA